jgi:hypothetical protein
LSLPSPAKKTFIEPQPLLNLTHRFGGLAFRTESDTPIPDLVSERFAKFQVENGPCDVVQRYRGVGIDAKQAPPADAELLERLRGCVPAFNRLTPTPLLVSPVVREALHSSLQHDGSVTVELMPNSISILDFAERETDFFYVKGKHEGILAKCQVMPIVCAHFLPLFSAFMVHSSGLTLGGRAAIFLAPDEGGKTTIASLSQQGTVLCDDQIIVRKEDRKFLAYGSPWGPFGHPGQKARVGGFFLLEKADRFTLQPVGPKAVFAYLWNEHENYRFFLPRDLKRRAFDLLYEACHAAPCYRLCFSKEHADWDAIDRALE